MVQLRYQPAVDVKKETSKKCDFYIVIETGGRMLSIKKAWITFGASDVLL